MTRNQENFKDYLRFADTFLFINILQQFGGAFYFIFYLPFLSTKVVIYRNTRLDRVKCFSKKEKNSEEASIMIK